MSSELAAVEGAEQEIRVLHVDDEPSLVDVAGEFLTRADDRITVETASTAADGLAAFRDGEFDCIVSDYEMPTTNGIEFLEQVRAADPDVPFVLYTGKGSEEVASEAISAGVTDYLQKESGTEHYKLLANRIVRAVEQYRTQRTVERTRRRFRTLVEEATDAILVVDEAATITYATASAETVLGRTPDELIGSSGFEPIHPADSDRVIEEFAELVADEDRRAVEFRYQRPDGNYIWAEARGRDLTDDPIIDGFVIYTRDVTDRKERELEAQRQQRRFEATFADPATLIGLVDTDGTLLEINDTALDLADADRDAVIGEPLWEAPLFTATAEVGAAAREWVERASNGEYVSFDHQISTDDGSIVTVEGVARPVTDDSGSVVSVLVSARDVTEQRSRAQELESTNALLSTLVETLPMGLLVEDESREILAANGRFLDLFDRPETVDELVGTDCERLAREASEAFVDPGAFRERIVKLVASGESVRDEHLRLADGSTLARSHESIALPEGDGHLWTYRDVTEERDRQRQLKRQAAFLENSPDMFFVLDETGTITYQNHASEEILGYEMTDLRGEAVLPYIHPDDRDTLEADFARLLDEPDEPVRSQYRFRLPNGEWHWFENRAINRLDDPTIGGILVINRDVTARRRREERLEALTETSRQLMGAETPAAIAEIGVEAARDVLDLPAVTINLYDEDDGGLVPVEYTEDVGDLVGEPPTFTPGNSIAWRVYAAGEPAAIDDVSEDPDVYNPESPIASELLVPIGDRGILLAGSTTPDTFDQSDVLLVEILAGAIARALEQVERTEELRARERELSRQNDRLTEFASVVSHDLRNPLNVAQGRLELARDGRESDHLQEAANALDRMHALIEDLLRLAREGETASDVESVDVGEVARDCWRTIETASAQLRTPAERTVVADRSRLRQLLENLVRNAVEHGGDGVTITVGDLPDGFFVADDGPGIPAAERESVFDVGYTTSNEGTGFGLGIVQQVAMAHGWNVTVTDSADGGARFELTGVEFAD